MLFLCYTILAGEPLQNLCYPIACIFLPTAAEGWVLILFMSHELVFWKWWYFNRLQLWNASISLTKCLGTSQQTRWTSKAFRGGKFLPLLETAADPPQEDAGSACSSQHRKKDILNKILNSAKVNSATRKDLVIQYTNNLFTSLSLLQTNSDTCIGIYLFIVTWFYLFWCRSPGALLNKKSVITYYYNRESSGNAWQHMY